MDIESLVGIHQNTKNHKFNNDKKVQAEAMRIIGEPSGLLLCIHCVYIKVVS